jgi:hypothetical protein
MENGKYILELAQFLPAPSIHFYIDAWRAMSSVNLNDISGFGETEINKIKSLITEKRLNANPQAVIKILIPYVMAANGGKSPDGLKILGKLIITHLREGKFQERSRSFSKIPINFLSYAVTEDLSLHGNGPNYTLVGKLLDKLVEKEMIQQRSPDRNIYKIIKARHTRYSLGDIAGIFLGYSFAKNNNLLPIVPFPGQSDGFVSVLLSEVRKLLSQQQYERLNVEGQLSTSGNMMRSR